MEGLSPK